MNLEELKQRQKNINVKKDFDQMQNFFNDILQDIEKNKDIVDLAHWLCFDHCELKKFFKKPLIKKIIKNLEKHSNLLVSIRMLEKIPEQESFYDDFKYVRKNKQDSFYHMIVHERLKKKINEGEINSLSHAEIEKILSMKELLSVEECHCFKHLNYDEKKINKSVLIEDSIQLFNINFFLGYINDYPSELLFSRFFQDQKLVYQYEQILQFIKNPEVLKIFEKLLIQNIQYEDLSWQLPEHLTLKIIDRLEDKIKNTLIEKVKDSTQKSNIDFNIIKTEKTIDKINKIILDCMSNNLDVKKFKIIRNLHYKYSMNLFLKNDSFLTQEDLAQSIVIKNDNQTYSLNYLQMMYLKISFLDDAHLFMQKIKKDDFLLKKFLEPIQILNHQPQFMEERNFINSIMHYSNFKKISVEGFELIEDKLNQQDKFTLLLLQLSGIQTLTDGLYEKLEKKINSFIDSLSAENNKIYYPKILKNLNMMISQGVMQPKYKNQLEMLYIMLQTKPNINQKEKKYGQKKI